MAEPSLLLVLGNKNFSSWSLRPWLVLRAIADWKAQAEHRAAQRQGRESFYSRYEVRVCNVERGYKHPKEGSTSAGTPTR